MSAHSVEGPEVRALMFSMDPPFTPEHQMFRRTLRDYVEKELAPHALEWDEAGIFPREVFRGLAEIGALGINYPDAGSDVANLRTTARRVGDDYVINGAKMWITNGSRADFITLAVRTGGPGYGGISLVTFPTDVKGFTVSRKLEKIGNLASDTALLFFEDC